ncbi:MAG: hypothetical protein U0791_13915 [Gemmataceae bacterium]
MLRVIEFLNGQMETAEVFAVEVKKFEGQGHVTLVPRLLGQTAGAEQKKSAGRALKRQWDEDSFFQTLAERRPPEDVLAARAIFDWGLRNGLRMAWGTGTENGSFTPTLDHETWHSIVVVYTSNTVEIQFQHMVSKRPFGDEPKRRELFERFNRVPGISLSADRLSKRPSFPLTVLREPASLNAFLGVLDWYVAEVRAT